MIQIDGTDTLFARKLYERIEKRKAELTDELVHSKGVKDFTAYHGKVGRIASLEEVLSMFQTVQSTIHKEEGRR